MNHDILKLAKKFEAMLKKADEDIAEMLDKEMKEIVAQFGLSFDDKTLENMVSSSIKPKGNPSSEEHKEVNSSSDFFDDKKGSEIAERIKKGYGPIKRTEIQDAPEGKPLPPGWAVVKPNELNVEIATFAKYALTLFLEKYGQQVGNHYGKSVIYFKSQDGKTIYAGRIERHQHQNATEHGGAGPGNVLMQAHPGVTMYKVS